MRAHHLTVLLVVTLCSLCLWESRSFAGGSTTSIFGSRRNGTMTVMGRPDDLSALFHNPAGLADQRGVNGFVFISPAFLSTGFRIKALDDQRFPAINPAGCGQDAEPACPWPVDGEGYYDRKIRPEKVFGVIPYLGASTDLGFLGPAGRDIVVAAAVYSPNFYGAFLPEEAPTSYHVIGGYFLVVSATVGAGWRVNDKLAVGASLSYNYMNLTMARRLSLAHSLTPAGETPGGIATVAQNLIGDIRMDYGGSEHGVGWSAAVLVHPLPWLGIGLTYNGSTNPKLEGDVNFETYNDAIADEEAFRELARTIGYKLPRRLVLEQSLPHALFFGVNIALGKQVDIGVDGRLWFYNVYSRQTVRPIYDDEEQGKEPLTEESLSREIDYQLSWQVTAGVAVRPLASYLGLELMLGAGYDQSPIPDETLTLDNPNLSHIKFSTGVRWRVTRRWRLAFTYLLNIYISRDIQHSQTSPPTNAQISSHSHSPALSADFTF